jgi:hypothetical protein
MSQFGGKENRGYYLKDKEQRWCYTSHNGINYDNKLFISKYQWY